MPRYSGRGPRAQQAPQNLQGLKNFGSSLLDTTKQTFSSPSGFGKTMKSAGQELGYLGNKVGGFIKSQQTQPAPGKTFLRGRQVPINSPMSGQKTSMAKKMINSAGKVAKAPRRDVASPMLDYYKQIKDM